VRNSALGGLALALAPVLHGQTAMTATRSRNVGPANRMVPLNRDWLFGDRADAHMPDKRKFSPVTAPHCVARLSWQNWDPASWEDVWMYRREFALPDEFLGRRTFLHFDGVMVVATPTINGHTLPQHLGGYLPFEYELTNLVKSLGNILNLDVDSRWSNVPPEGSPAGPSRIDYLEAGGLHRSVWLQAVPQVFIRDVFAKPVNVLDPGRHIEISCCLDAAVLPEKPVQVEVELRDGVRVVSRVREEYRLEKVGIVNVWTSPTLARFSFGTLRHRISMTS
jgi:beta-galactosidase